jgi:hypothetical protein
VRREEVLELAALYDLVDHYHWPAEKSDATARNPLVKAGRKATPTVLTMVGNEAARGRGR